MTAVNSQTPKIRFPEFNGDWQQKKGGDAFKSRRDRGEEGLPLYSVTIDRGMVRRDSLDREFASNATDESNLRAEKDDLVYNMMRMWQGAVGRAPEACMVSPAYVVLSPKVETSPQFFEHWFKRARSIYLMWAYSYGLTKDRLRLYFLDFARVPMALPNADEQQKVGAFLGTLDARIEVLRDRLDALQQYKTAMLQRIFSQNIRFKRNDGSAFPDWEEVSLGSVSKFVKGRGISKEDIIIDGAVPCIRYGELYTVYGETVSKVVSKTNSPPDSLLLSELGDVILPASGETPMDMPSAACVLTAGVALGGDITVIRTSINGIFLAYMLRSYKRRAVARLAQGISVVHLYGTHLASLKLVIPSDPNEQLKIANFLIALDDKIAAVSAQVDQTQAFKNGLLQQMFV